MKFLEIWCWSTSTTFSWEVLYLLFFKLSLHFTPFFLSSISLFLLIPTSTNYLFTSLACIINSPLLLVFASHFLSHRHSTLFDNVFLHCFLFFSLLSVWRPFILHLSCACVLLVLLADPSRNKNKSSRNHQSPASIFGNKVQACYKDLAS